MATEEELIARRNEYIEKLEQKGRLSRGSLRELNKIQNELRQRYDYKKQDAPNLSVNRRGELVAKTSGVQVGQQQGSADRRPVESYRAYDPQSYDARQRDIDASQRAQERLRERIYSDEQNVEIAPTSQPAQQRQKYTRDETEQASLRLQGVETVASTPARPSTPYSKNYGQSPRGEQLYSLQEYKDQPFKETKRQTGSLLYSSDFQEDIKPRIRQPPTRKSNELPPFRGYELSKEIGAGSYEAGKEVITSTGEFIKTKTQSAYQSTLNIGNIFDPTLLAVGSGGELRRPTTKERLFFAQSEFTNVASTGALFYAPTTQAGRLVFGGLSAYQSAKEGVPAILSGQPRQIGRGLTYGVIGGLGALDVYATGVKPTFIRATQRRVKDEFLSPKSKEFGGFDDPLGTKRQKLQEFKRRELQATKPTVSISSYTRRTTSKLFIADERLASNVFLIDRPKTVRASKRGGYVELTSSAQAGVKATQVQTVGKARAGLEDAGIFFSFKGGGEPAFLRILKSTKSQGYSLVGGIGDYFRTPTLFNTRVSGVKLLPKRIRYARREGFLLSRNYYESVANKQKVFGYMSLRSSPSYGVGKPSLVTVQEDFTFKNGKVVKAGEVRKYGTTKEDEIILGTGQKFTFKRDKGLRGLLASKLFKSTGRYIDVYTGDGYIPVPVQEVKLTTSKRRPTRENILKERRLSAKVQQRSIKDAYESYAKARQTLSKPIFFSRVSVVSRASRVSQVSRVSRISRVSTPSRVSQVSRVSRVPVVSRVSRPSQVSRASQVSRVSRVTDISRVGTSRVTRTPPPTTPARVILKFKPFIPRVRTPTLKTRRLGKRYTPSITALFRTRNIFKLGKRSTGLGVTSGLGVRF